MEELKKHGTLLPPDIMGLTDEQVVELKLIDTWGEKCIPFTKTQLVAEMENALMNKCKMC
jgi:hypothetical protein